MVIKHAMTDIRQYLRTACPHCKSIFEFPSDYYGESQPCPHCQTHVQFVPRPALTLREYELTIDDKRTGPFAFDQFVEMYKPGRVTLNSTCRILPGTEWRSVRELRLDDPDAKPANQLIFYVKTPELSYPLGPFSFLKLVTKMEQRKIPPESLFFVGWRFGRPKRAMSIRRRSFVGNHTLFPV